MFSFWPRSVENRAALRTAVATLAAVLLAFKFHLQSPYWSGMSVAIVANLYTGSILDKAMMRIVGTLCGAVIGYSLAGFIANSFFLYLVVSFLIIAVSVYFYHYSSYGYAYLLGALCAFIIIAQVTIDPQNAFLVAIWRPVEIGLGVVVFAISVYAIVPNHLKDNTQGQVYDLFQSYYGLFDQLLLSLSTPVVPSFTDIATANLKIKKNIRKATELITAMNHELGVSQAQIDELRALLNTFIGLSRQIHYLTALPLQHKDLSLLQQLPVHAVLLAIKNDLAQLQAAYANTASFKVMPLQTQSALDQLEQQVKEHWLTYRGANDFIHSFLIFLQQVNQSLVLINALFAKNPIEIKKTYKTLDKKDRLRADPQLIKHSIKAGLAVLLALGFWLISNWPGGINGIISSLVISIRKNLFEMKNVIIHRLIGCSIGGGLALTSLAVVEMNLYDFIIFLFLAVWGFTYFMFRFPKYSYIGLQANIAFIIALAQEGGPPVLLDPPLQRLAGVVIGIVASFIVANVLWRSDVWTILSRYLQRIYSCIVFNLNQVFSVTTEQKSLHDVANLFWLSRGLIESLTDSSLNPQKQQRLTALSQEFESLVTMQATVSYILVSIDRARAATTAALFGVNLPAQEHQLTVLYEAKDKIAGGVLVQQFKEFLTVLEKDSSVMVDYIEVRNLSAYINALIQLALCIP